MLKRYVTIIPQMFACYNRLRWDWLWVSAADCAVDIFVDNMCITMERLWIKSATAPLYVSGYARAVPSFLRSMTLWIAAFRWCGWLGGLAKT